MSPLANLKTALWKNFFVPFMSNRGWKPAYGTDLGLAFEKMSFGFEDEQEIKKAARLVSTHTMVSFERLATLWEQARYLDQNQIAGVFVECGVWKGGSSGMLALAHSYGGKPSRELHMFDSFEGLPEPKAELDGERAILYAQEDRSGGKLEPIGKCVGSLEENKQLIEQKIRYPSELIHYHKGWFEQTVPPSASTLGPIALLRLDGDWYESTKVCLDHLFDKVVSGGIIVIDDYGHWEGCRRAVDEFLKNRGLKPYLHHIDYTGRYFFKD